MSRQETALLLLPYEENASILAIATAHSKGATLNEIALQERLPLPILPFYQESYLKFQKVKASVCSFYSESNDARHEV
jgi:hypothetical protein